METLKEEMEKKGGVHALSIQVRAAVYSVALSPARAKMEKRLVHTVCACV